MASLALLFITSTVYISRHPCCFLSNCTKFECPTCHLKVKMCQPNCPCNILTSGELLTNAILNLFCSLLEEKVAVPWEKNPRERSPGIEDDKPAEEQFCGAPECSRKCSAGEWCANSGTECQEYPCCSSSKCVTFNS